MGFHAFSGTGPETPNWISERRNVCRRPASVRDIAVTCLRTRTEDAKRGQPHQRGPGRNGRRRSYRGGERNSAACREVVCGCGGRDRRKNRGEGALGITSGYIGIDKLTGGLRPKTLTIVGGRTSMGKSSFLANIALNVAGNGKRVHFQALEESSESIATRMLSNRGRISTMRISARNLDMEELDRVIRAAKNLSSHAIIIDETCGISSENICARIRKAHSAAPYDLVIIDNIQRIREREATRHMEISRAIQTFKNLAKEISTPVIVASQIARAAEDGRDARPELRNLKESGDLEQEADVVMLLYRPSYYDKNMIDKSSVEIAIGKNRDGPTGHVDLRWSPTVMEFHEDVRGEDQNGATEAGAHWSDR